MLTSSCVCCWCFEPTPSTLSVRAGRCLERAYCAAAAAWLMLCTPTTALAAPEALPYQEADQTPETQKAKSAPLSQDKQSAATDSSSQLPPLPTSFPLLPDIVVQAPQEVSSVLVCLLHANRQELQGEAVPLHTLGAMHLQHSLQPLHHTCEHASKASL